MPLVGEPAWPPLVLYCNDNGFLQSKLYSEETLSHSGLVFFFPLPPHLSEASNRKPFQAREVVACAVRGCSRGRPNWRAGVLSCLSASLSTTPNPELVRGRQRHRPGACLTSLGKMGGV